MRTEVILLFPFDLGLELGLSDGKADEVIRFDTNLNLPTLSLSDRFYPGGSVRTQLYRFGAGVIQVRFWADMKLNECVEISCSLEKVRAGDTALTEWCQSRVQEMIDRAQPYAIHRYDLRLKESDLFPVFILSQSDVENADLFIRENYKALYGIVSGESNFDMLSDFVFQKEPLGNFGYYENELVLLKRFGAVISSGESKTILDLTALAYAQYWNLKAYHYVLDREIDSAQKILEDLPPYYKFWQIPSRYQRFSEEAIAFSKDKISIVESLYSVPIGLPRIESDWHLRTVYNDIVKVFNIDELYRTVEAKLNRIEETYNQAREFLSTNFFILLDIIFFLWLAWGVIDTFLLLTIARK